MKDGDLIEHIVTLRRGTARFRADWRPPRQHFSWVMWYGKGNEPIYLRRDLLRVVPAIVLLGELTPPTPPPTLFCGDPVFGHLD